MLLEMESHRCCCWRRKKLKDDRNKIKASMNKARCWAGWLGEKVVGARLLPLLLCKDGK